MVILLKRTIFITFVILLIVTFVTTIKSSNRENKSNNEFSYNPMPQEEFIDYFKFSSNYLNNVLKQSRSNYDIRINSFIPYDNNYEDKIFTLVTKKDIPKQEHFIEFPSKFVFSTCVIYPIHDLVLHGLIEFVKTSSKSINSFIYPLQWSYYILFLKHYDKKTAKNKAYFDDKIANLDKKVEEYDLIKNYSTQEDKEFAEFVVKYSKLLVSGFTLSNSQNKLAKLLESFDYDIDFIKKANDFLINYINNSNIEDEEKKSIAKIIINSKNENDLIYIMQFALQEGHILNIDAMKYMYSSHDYELYFNYASTLDPQKQFLFNCFYSTPIQPILNKGYVSSVEKSLDSDNLKYPLMMLSSFPGLITFQLTSNLEAGKPISYFELNDFTNEEAFINIGACKKFTKIKDIKKMLNELKESIIINATDELTLLADRLINESNTDNYEKKDIVMEKIQLIKKYVNNNAQYSISAEEINQNLLNVFRLFYYNPKSFSDLKSSNFLFKLQNNFALSNLSEINALWSYNKLIRKRLLSKNNTDKLFRYYFKLKEQYELGVKDFKRLLPEVKKYLSIISFTISKNNLVLQHRSEVLKETKFKNFEYLKVLKSKIVS